MTRKLLNSNQSTLAIILWAFVLIAVATPPASAVTSPVQVQMGGNATVGRILSLELVVNSIQLVPSKGSAVSLVSLPYTLEQSHLAASAEVVGRVNVPVGVYTRAILTVANPHVVYLDNFGNIRGVRWTGASTSSVSLVHPINVAAAASVIRVSLDLASLMKFDPTQQTMLRTQPTFTLFQLFPAKVGPDAEVAGELESTVGKVVAVSGASFILADAVSGLTTTYITDSKTAYNGVSLRTMVNLFVRVHSATRADGQLLTQEVSIAGSGLGSVVTGVITDYSGTKVAVQQIYGSGAPSSALGTFRTLILDPATAFQLDSRGMDLTAIPLVFNVANLVAGQRIQFASRGAMQSSSVAGPSMSQVLSARLQLQTLIGTVTSVGVADNGGVSFDLQLPVNDGSPLTSLGEGTGLIHIITQPLTKSSLTASSLTEGLPVRVRGLLFFDASASGLQSNGARGYVTAPKGSSNYYMVARSFQRDAAARN